MTISMPWWVLVGVISIASAVGCIVGLMRGGPKV